MRAIRGSLIAAGVAALMLGGCSSGNDNAPTQAVANAGDLGKIKARGSLTVVTRNAPTTYYLDRDTRARGPEHDMAAAYAKHLGVKLNLVVADSITGVLDALQSGKADIAAAGLTSTPARAERFLFGPTYQQVHQQVVCRSGGKKARKISQLADVNLVVIDHSSYVTRLQALKKDHPDLRWQTNDKLGTEQLLRQVWQKKIDCTVADSNIVKINRRYYPELLVTFDLSKPQDLAWAMPKDANKLRQSVNAWFKDYKKSGRLAELRATYYDYIPEFDYVDKKKLHERIESRYGKFDHLFERAAKQHDIPEGLLAAQGYQESHWDPKAKSATGVRGIMMLTKPTARELGVKNRLNPGESINGGAKYLQTMQERLSDDIGYPDKTYFALAAYNIGLAHLHDAQKLAKRMGKDPHSWADVRETLPLLADKRYYPSLKYGYARGTEPVRYVQRIRDYEDVIKRVEN